MADKRHEPEQIVTKPRPVDVLVGQGMVRADAILIRPECWSDLNVGS